VKSASGQFELFDNFWMQESGKIGAGRHADGRMRFRERLLDGAGATDAVAAFENENALAVAREIGGTGEAVVAGADDDHVPRPGSEFSNRRG
jgi:hypothetical protein